MKTSLLASLESHIESFIEEIHDDPDRPDGLFHPSLASQMAQAAAAVFDATAESSTFTSRETNP